MSSLLAAALWFASLATAAIHLDVQGTARLGDTPEPDVVVWLESPALSRSMDSRRTVLDQRNLRFSPRVLAVQVGTIVDFPNNDRVFHNVFSFRDGKKFDLGLYPIGSVKRVTFDKPGVSRIFCNIHPQMAAYVVAVDSPAFAVSDDTGAFTLRGVPEGSYTYHAWRAGTQPLTGSVTLRPGQPLDIRWP
ncbi:MAG TPA: carboxypeptidase regulatory-like domain-containing protein [Vicinamibacterales bacterium]|jgi:plastocyanin